LNSNHNISEELIYKIWEEKRFNDSLTTADGILIEILDPGVRNNDQAGPDYHNARVRIGNITFTGDVEIDRLHSDWKAHGHHLNQRYNKIILHAVLSNDSSYPFVVTANGRKVPTLELEKFLNSSVKENLTKDLPEIKDENNVKMPCVELNHNMERREKLRFIKTLGLLRFRKKCERNLERLKELIILNENKIKEPKVYHDFQKEISSRQFSNKDFSDLEIWQQLIYEQVFEALGYSKNKDIMLRLSRAADIKFFKQIESANTEKIESILLHISGLIPPVTEIADEETSAYLRKCLDLWSEVKDKYDSQIFIKTQWHFFKLRPQNFPTVRLAAGSRFLEKLLNKNMFSYIASQFTNINDIQKLIARLRNDIVIKGDGYWANHFNFNKPTKSKLNYFIGIGRADEIIVNILLPIYSVYFELQENKELSHRVLELYLNFYQKEGNHLVDQVNDVLGFKNEKYRSVYYQGMIDLFRSYCIKKKCMECEIGKKVFT
jgi:hypothetical protein